MRKDLYAILNIEKNESSSVLLFLLQSVFLGIFYGAFDVGAHALFLSVYPAEMIPKAYVISGIAGIILTSAYARIQNKLKFSSLAFINLVFIAIATALLRLMFQFTESSWLIFVIFVMMGPLNIIALLGFWGAVGRMFTLRQGKRLFGLIDSGQIFGAILSAFAIPILISFGFQQKNLLFLSSVSIICAVLIQIVISIKFNLNQVVKKAEEKQKRLKDLLKNRYILYMSIFVILSMLTAFFVQYSFLTVTKDNYPDHNDLTEFLGAFTGSLLLFTFLFKTFVYSKLMKTYGLRFSIIVSSFLIGIFTVIAIIIGTVWGYTSAANSFIFFFLIISLSRLFSKALKDGVEVPSFKILYQSLKADIRHDVQAYVDGTINEIAALSAGLMLAALGMFEFFTLIHFSYSLFIILIIWFFVARKLYVEYKRSLEKSLAEYKGQSKTENNVSDFIYSSFEKNISSDTKIVSGLEMDAELHPYKFEKNIESIINSKNKEIRDFAVNRVLNSKIINSYKYLYDKDIRVDKKFQEVIEQAISMDKNPGLEKIIVLSKSKSSDERVLAAFLIGKFYEKDLFVYLKSLIRDLNIQVKVAAIKSAETINQADLCPLIIDYLDTPGVFPVAYDSLLKIGDNALNYLDQVFYKSGTEHRVLLRIVKLFGEIGSEKAKSLLLNKLDHPNEEILFYILQSLKKCEFKADESNINRIHQIIEKHIGVMAWNIAARLTLKEIEEFNYLKVAIGEELASNYNLLYLLLSLAYDSKSVMHVKENIESGTSEGVSYALELLDLFISDEIKSKLFPIVEDIPDFEKIKQLQNFYAVEKLDINELLIDIINRDVNFINVWTKTCAIQALIELENNNIPDDLIAHIFNPVEILRQTAAVAVNTMHQETYDSIRDRMNESYLDDLDNTIESLSVSRNSMIIEKTMFLKQIEYFKDVPGRYLYQIAYCMNEFKSDLSDFSNIIVSDLYDKILLIKDNPVTIIIEDQEIFLEESKIYNMNEFISDKTRDISIKGENSTIFFILKSDLIYNIFDYYEIEASIIKWFSGETENEEILTS